VAAIRPQRDAMSERDSDIEFDFFDEGETREASAAERPRRRGPRPPVRPPAGLTPLLRLIGLISFAILIVVLLVFWVNSCREDQRKDSYRNYMQKVNTVAQRSEALGRDLNTLLTARGKKQDELEQELEGLAQQQEQLENQADDLDPPGPLRPAHRHIVESFQLRVSGLRGMALAFRQTATLRDAAAAQAGAQLSQQAIRLVASDVVWDDLFQGPARGVLRREDIRGVNVPDSTFLREPDISTKGSMTAIWRRIHGAATGGGSCSPRGTSIVSTTALPARQQLTTDELNTVESTNDLAFAVAVKNSGCAQEVGIAVTLTIQKSPSPIVKRSRIDLINPGETKTVNFTNIGTPPFGERTNVTVEVAPVQGEATTDNNTSEYPVVFSLG
jgi:type II secretory pathway component PulJ